MLDFGEWRSEVASRHNPDGTVSFVTTDPRHQRPRVRRRERADKRTLVVRDAQHEYVFNEK